MSRIAVVAVGGNALTRQDQQGTAEEIETNAAQMATAVSALLDAGWRVVVVHGNGPQVGNLSIQQESGVDMVPPQPLYSLSAMSQGQLGSILVRAINDQRGPGTAVAVVSHMVVDLQDAAFNQPSKPIGPFFPADVAAQLGASRGWEMAEDAGRGYRRVVPSPCPGEFLEASAVAALLDAGKVVLAAGGGGVAVSRDATGHFRGVDVVIDKDSAAARLAISLGAQALLLVTGVDAVSIDFGKPTERVIHDVPVDDARQYLAEGQFPPGSMGPKVKAAIDFVAEADGTSVITSAGLLVDALDVSSTVGTRIVPTRVMSPA
ncbi:MAG: carbamate kinase [Aeromicrobium sp.]|jgi:carbamate kinase|uniref:carbamate kinase n=1 Tax=Aeromicrobium sp. TaxID=1871063 RepID=UPI00261D0A2A|nr:carbamate kinase [Aeromicrobium sp.]MCW2788669.1 carbamate kinase [Aeromicrobium sp.]MCW2825623.1 carbamate kinase [Aeromicrobium sp.]